MGKSQCVPERGPACAEPKAVFVLSCPNVYPCNNGTEARLDIQLFRVSLFNFYFLTHGSGAWPPHLGPFLTCLVVIDESLRARHCG